MARLKHGEKIKSSGRHSGEVRRADLGYSGIFPEAQTRRDRGEIAGALGLPQSSTTMLLKSLLNLGYLDFTPQTRKFRPTVRVAVLGSWIQQSLFESGPLTDTMDAIGSATGETVLLGLQNGPHMQYVHIVVPSQGVLLAAQVGILRPMTCAALGRVLLSRKTNEEIKAIVRRNNADAADSAHRVQERQFMVEIESIRSQGFAESRGKMVPGANVIGMLIPDQNDTTPLAIGVGGPMVRIEERRDEILRVLRRYLHRK